MKKLLILTLAFILCLTLVGCTDKEETDTTIDKTTQESEEVADLSIFDYFDEDDYEDYEYEDYYDSEYDLEHYNY